MTVDVTGGFECGESRADTKNLPYTPHFAPNSEGGEVHDYLRRLHDEHGTTPAFMGALVNRREAAIFAAAGAREGVDYIVYPDLEDEPLADPVARALEHRRNRNTGPAAPPLDPRRRRQRR
ncbi:hypothetical protein [Micromonospora sediminicola]|uniref:hypothetical protein n=1 Tax=Micromonospora sediminicola TaxID=946078 RepID=UPI003789D832